MSARPRTTAPFADGGPLARAVLRLAGLAARPLRRFGVEPAAFRTLLAVEFVLGARRVRQAKSEGSGGAAAGVALSLLANVMLGLLSAIALTQFDDPLWGMAAAQAVLMVFITLALVGDHLPAFLDTAQVGVVAATPVRDRTVLAARLVHLVSQLALSVLALSLLPMVFGSVRFAPWFAPLYLAAGALGSVTCVGLACGLFLLAARLLDPERFRDALLYLQVGVFVGFVAGWQFLPRYLELERFRMLVGARSPWLALLPPFHGGGLLALATGERSTLAVALAVLAVLTPMLVLVLVLGLAARGFVARLAALAMPGRDARPLRRRARLVRDVLLRSPAARAGYDFFAALSRRERQFRMRTYPMLAMAVVLGLAFALRSGELAAPAMLCGSLYMLGIYAPAFVVESRHSENAEARWLFQVVPLAAPGELLLGSLTALLATFVLPAAALIGGLLLVLGGFQIAADVAFALASVVLVTVLAMHALGRRLPFTEVRPKGVVEGQFGRSLVMLAVVGGFVAVHTILRHSPPAFAVALVAQPVIAWWLFRGLRRVRPVAPWLSGRQAAP